MKNENAVAHTHTIEHLSLEGEGGTQCQVRRKVKQGTFISTPSSVLRTSSKAEKLFDNPPTPLRGTSPTRGADNCPRIYTY